MKFINAYEGLKKIFVSQVISVISLLFVLITNIIILVAFEDFMSYELSLFCMSCIIVLSIIAGVIGIAGIVFEILGLNQARKDERYFKKALFFLFIDIAAVLVTVLTGRGMFNNIFSGISETATLLVNVYIIMGVFDLADQMDQKEVESRGKITLVSMVVVFVLSVIVRFFGIFVDDGDILYSIISVICLALEIVVFLIFLTYLSKAKKMLVDTEQE